MKKTLTVAICSLVLAACAGSTQVITIDGVSLNLEDIPVETDASTIELEVFRNALNWVVADRVLTTAAAEQFGITFSDEEVLALAEAGLAASDSTDPRSTLGFLKIQARFGQSGLLWQQLAPLLSEGVLPIEWALDQLRAADVEVSPKYGEWRIDPEPAVYGP